MIVLACGHLSIFLIVGVMVDRLNEKKLRWYEGLLGLIAILVITQYVLDYIQLTLSDDLKSRSVYSRPLTRRAR